jgi:hypothetical protein
MRSIVFSLAILLVHCESSRNHARGMPTSETRTIVHAMNHDAQNNDHDAMGPPSTTIAYGGAEITLTVSDAKAIESALVAYLDVVDVKEVEDRDYLLAQTRGGPSWIDTDGVVRISAWLLQTRPTGLVLTFRMPAPDEAGVMKGYVASLIREEKWKVAHIDVERIRRRR